MIRRRKHLGNALRFLNEFGEEVDTNNNTTLSLQANQANSFEFLIRYSTTLGGRCALITNRTGVSPNGFFIVRYYTNTAQLALAYTRSGNLREAGWDLSGVAGINKWLHIIITKPVSDDPLTWKCYVNKELIPINITYNIGSLPTIIPDRTTILGKETVDYYLGYMYIARVYDKELTQAETLELGQIKGVPASASANVVLDYDFNQTKGTFLPDKSGNNNHGTLIDFGSTTDYGGGAWVNEKGNTAK